MTGTAPGQVSTPPVSAGRSSPRTSSSGPKAGISVRSVLMSSGGPDEIRVISQARPPNVSAEMTTAAPASQSGARRRNAATSSARAASTAMVARTTPNRITIWSWPVS